MLQVPAANTLDSQRDDRLVAGYAALAIVIHILEAGFPSPLPGIKPGLANVVTLIVLLRHGWRMAAWVAVLRVLVASLLVGSFMTPGFWLSASGAVAALAVLGVADLIRVRLPAAWQPSALGLSVLAALAHMAGQFTLAYTVFVPHPGLLHLLPLLLTVALVFATLTGYAAQRILDALANPDRTRILPP